MRRRRFLSSVGEAGGAALVTTLFGPETIRNVEAAAQRTSGRSPEDLAADENYWSESPAGVQRFAIDHQPEQRRGLPVTPDGHRSFHPLHLAAGGSPRVHDVADPAAPQGERAAAARGGLRVRSGRGRARPEHLGSHGNPATGHGSPVRRRDPHHHPGLWADAHHHPPTDPPRGDRPQVHPDPDSRRDRRRGRGRVPGTPSPTGRKSS